MYPNSTKNGTPVSRDIHKNALKREEIREEFWPGKASLIWDPSSQKLKGFVGVSRLTPWITTLIRHLAKAKSGDPTGVYWEFWCRHMGQGIVEIKDEEECAFAAGYTSSRALRTWRDHVQMLKDLGFADFTEVGNRKVGYVFLPNPLGIARWYSDKGKTPKGWWASFRSRAREIGADIPDSIDPELFSKSSHEAESVG